MPDPRQLAVEALENAGMDADDAAQAVADLAEAGVLPVGEGEPTILTEEWGVRYTNLDDQPVYVATDGEQSARQAMNGYGEVLVRRLKSDWQEVTDE